MLEWDDELDRAQTREDRRLQYGLAAERRAETEILLEQDEHKELLFLLAVCRYSTSRIAGIRGQSDRNIRKVRATILKRLHKKMLDALKERAETGAPMTLEEKALWGEYKKSVLDGGKGGSYNGNCNFV